MNRGSTSTAFCAAISICAIVGLSGCKSSLFNGDRGPQPILSPDEVVPASAKANLIIDALERDNGINENSPSAYYDIAVAGFNFIDDQCNAYFDHLFFLDRERNTVKTILNSANATSGAILGITKAGSVTLEVVAQAFGFASAATDAAAGTFLYQLPPATTLGFVSRQQTAFRIGVADQQSHHYIHTRQDAYHFLQQYLAICLPPTIEAELVKQISGSKSAPDRDVAPGSMAVVTGSAPPTSVPVVRQNNDAAKSSARLIHRANAPIPVVVRPTPPPEAEGKVLIPIRNFNVMQKEACQTPGDATPDAVGALVTFLHAHGLKDENQPDTINLNDFNELHFAKRQGLQC